MKPQIILINAWDISEDVGRGAEDIWTFLRPDIITEGPGDMGRRFRLSFVYSEKLNQARSLGL